MVASPQSRFRFARKQPRIVLAILEGRILKVTVATCQFPVDADIRSNKQYVLRQMRAAKERGRTLPISPKPVSQDTREPTSDPIVALTGVCSKHARDKFSIWRTS
jgi:hypothetical protein